MSVRTRQTFIQGTMILLAAGIVNRLLGFAPRIILPRIIGAEGIGLYQMGYPFLIVILTLISGGIPLAVAKLVAEAETAGQERQVRRILKTALSLTTGLSLLFTALCILAAKWISTHLLTDARVYYTFLSMSPIILMVGISSVYRGYYQGRQNMIPTAVSQVAETVARIVFSLLLAYLAVPYGIEYAAAAAMAGVMIGEAFGMLTLLNHSRKEKASPTAPLRAEKGPKPAHSGVWSKLLSISLPVTFSKLVGSGSYFLESIMIVQSLAVAGVATAAATAQYGILQGMVIPILLLPGALTYSLSISLVPSLSEAAARNDLKTIHKRLHQSLRLALVTGAPFAVVMMMLAEPLCYYLYRDAEVGRMLMIMAPAALFIYCQSPLQAALQALDRPGTALLNTFVGACVKLVLIYLLASQPRFGIVGAVLAINTNMILVTLLHWRSVVKLLGFSLRRYDLIKIGSAMMLMGIACYGLMHYPWIDSNFGRFAVSGMLGSALYFGCILRFGLVEKNDFSRVPLLRRIIKPR